VDYYSLEGIMHLSRQPHCLTDVIRCTQQNS